MGDTHGVGDLQSVSTVNTERTDEWQFYKPCEGWILHKGVREQQCPVDTHVQDEVKHWTATHVLSLWQGINSSASMTTGGFKSTGTRARVSIYDKTNLLCKWLWQPRVRTMQFIYSERSWFHFVFKPATSLGVTYTLQDIRQPIGPWGILQQPKKKPHPRHNYMWNPS